MAMTTERIEINPAIMMGKPVIRGTRITVELILRKLAEGASEGELLQDYPHLTTEDIRAAVAYGAASVAHEEVSPALTRWAKVCRASGAGRNANSLFSSQRLRAGLKCVAPTAFVGGRRSEKAREGARRTEMGRMMRAAPPVLRALIYHAPSAYALG